MDLISIDTIKELIKKYNLSPSQASGQNFLVDKKVLKIILTAARIKKADNVLEIGPGLGVLTRELAAKSVNIVAVESDPKLVKYLKKEFLSEKNVKIVEQDILKVDNAELFKSKPYRIVSNIPYQITGKIIRKFVSAELPKPTDMVLMVQKEVAERICAQPGKMSLLAISVQLYARPKIVAHVSKESFWPVPEVESSVLAIEKISPEPLYNVLDLEKFWRVARIGFSSPRKQLHNNIAAGFGIEGNIAKEALRGADLGEHVRAQELSVGQWASLAEILTRVKIV